MGHLPSRSVLSLLAVAALVSIGCAPPPPPAPPPAPAVSAPPPPPKPHWSLVSTPPDKASSWRTLPLAQGELRVDRGGYRWLLSSEHPMGERAESPLPSSPVALDVGSGEELILLGADRSAYVSTSLLGALARRGELPKGLPSEAVHIFRGGLSAVTRGKAWVSTDETTWKEAGAFGLRAPIEALVGRDGKGLGLFAPQAIATTSDAGATWTAIPVEDRERISSLSWDSASPQEVLLPPVRQRDHALRTWTLGDSVLHAETSNDSGERYRSRWRWRSPPLSEASSKERLTEALTARVLVENERELPVLDGDRLLTSPFLVEEHQPAVVTSGPLGEPRHSLDVMFSYSTSRSVKPTFAACDGSVLLLAGKSGVLKLATGLEVPVELTKSKAYSYQHQLAVPLGPGVFLGYDQGNRMVSRFQVEGEKVTTTELVLGGEKLLEFTSPLSADAKPIASNPVFSRMLGSCHGATPAAWLINSSSDNQLIVTVASQTEQARALVLKGELDPLGVGDDGSLILLQRGKEPASLRVSTSLAVTKTPLSFEPKKLTYLEELSQGHALTLSKEGRPLQSDDEGKSWTPISSPPLTTSENIKGIVCGTSRCLVGDTAIHLGWERDDVTLGSSSQEPKAEPGNSAAVGDTLHCTVDDAREPKLPADVFIRELGFGQGTLAWQAIASDRSINSDGARYKSHPITVWMGAGDGSVSSKLLTSTKSLYFEGGVLGFPYVIVPMDMGRFVAPNALALDLWWLAPKGAAQHVQLTTANLGSGFLQTDSGVAYLDGLAKELHWRHANGHEEKLDWPGRDSASIDSLQGARVTSSRDWPGLVLLASYDFHPEEVSEGLPSLMSSPPPRSLELLGYDLNRVRHERVMTWEALGLPETAFGVLHDSGGVSLVGMEWRPDGGRELRARPVLPDLSLGEPVSLRGGAAAADAPFNPPACGTPVSGEWVEVVSTQNSSLRLNGEELRGRWGWRLRVAQQAVCTEGRFFQHDNDGAMDGLASEAHARALFAGAQTSVGIASVSEKLHAIKCQ